MIKCDPLRSKGWLPVLFMVIIENGKAMADVEKVASGIPRMQEAIKAVNLLEPKFHTEGMFAAVFKRKTIYYAISGTVNGTVNGIVSENT